MKNKNVLILGVLVIASYVTIPLSAKAQTPQTTPASPFKVTADLVSSYVWRGILSTAAPSPSIQPSLAFVKGGFEIGVWGSTDFTASYKETDLYVSFATGRMKFTLTDYFWFNTNTETPRYFDYKNKTTNHIFEGSVAYSGSQSFPLSIAVHTMFAGADKKYNFNSNAPDPRQQAYSTYIELGYTFKHFAPFLGISPFDGYYGDGYGGSDGFFVGNFGITSNKALKITDTYWLPLKATLGVNPQKEDIYLVFGITF